jgi:NAD(P)-dependent dehydrogenase (short-subunit alcohol dehydrogenase family)
VGDVAERGDLPDLVRKVAYHFGAPDILINAAGINTRQPADAVTPEGWDATIALNLTAPFFLAQAFVPAMKVKGWGRVVNFASLQSRRAFAGGISYGASKGGVEQMTRAMAEAWSRDGIMCNAVAPGFFRTELTGPVFANPALSQKHADATCIGRNGEVADMDGPMVFLCSPASDYVTGQVLFVDGGYTAK